MGLAASFPREIERDLDAMMTLNDLPLLRSVPRKTTLAMLAWGLSGAVIHCTSSQAQEEEPRLLSRVGILSRSESDPPGLARSVEDIQQNRFKILMDASNQLLQRAEQRLPEGPERLRAELLRAAPLGFPTLIRTKSLPDRGAPSASIGPTDQPTESLLRAERIVGEPNFLPASFVLGAHRSLRPVGRVVLKIGPRHSVDVGIGTGFLVGSRWVLTNNHVIPSESEARRYSFQLNYQHDESGGLGPIVEYEFDPGEREGIKGFYTDPLDDGNPATPDLDFTLIRLKVVAGDPPGVAFGTIRLNQDSTLDDYLLGVRFNVIQHPQGRPKEVVIHDNKYMIRYDHFVRYTADTDPGSSGSPVFDDYWNLVALHHSAGDFDGMLGQYINNEGVRIDSIIKAMRDAAVEPDVPAPVLVDIGLSN